MIKSLSARKATRKTDADVAAHALYEHRIAALEAELAEWKLYWPKEAELKSRAEKAETELAKAKQHFTVCPEHEFILRAEKAEAEVGRLTGRIKDLMIICEAWPDAEFKTSYLLENLRGIMGGGREETPAAANPAAPTPGGGTSPSGVSPSPPQLTWGNPGPCPSDYDTCWCGLPPPHFKHSSEYAAANPAAREERAP